jgi:hypothetical protein
MLAINRDSMERRLEIRLQRSSYNRTNVCLMSNSIFRHLEGSIRLSTLTEIAKASSTKHDIPIGQEERYWRSIFHIEEPTNDLTQMLDRVYYKTKYCDIYSSGLFKNAFHLKLLLKE